MSRAFELFKGAGRVRPRWQVTFAAFILMLVLQSAALAYLALMYSPTPDEVAYLPAGISHWRYGRFELYRANPHLVRMVAALPVLAMEYESDWSAFREGPGIRSDHAVGIMFVEANGASSFRMFTAARLACIPLVLVGGVVCWLWASELYGPWAGLVATGLWCCCPNILGNGALITPDVAATSFGALAGYLFWRWLGEPTLVRAWYAGLALGVAEFTKTNWLVLYALWPALWIVWQLANHEPGMKALLVRAAQLACILCVSVFVLNAGYGFDGTCKRLGDYEFVSMTLRGPADLATEPHGAERHGGRSLQIAQESGGLGNRFREGWLNFLPIPLPEQYVLGIDIQRASVEGGKPAYLWGVWKHGGWWYYYLAAMCVKVPTGMLLLVALALGARLHRMWQAPAAGQSPGERSITRSVMPTLGATWRDELVLLAPAVVTLLFISSQTGINRHFRYALPILPFLFIWVSSLAAVATANTPQAGSLWLRLAAMWKRKAPQAGRSWLRQRGLAILAAGCLGWSFISSALVYPHSMSYFNELAGGPRGGSRYLLGSSTDWGQDMLFLKAWLDKHPEARPLTVRWHIPHFRPQLAGIDYPTPPKAPDAPAPGWHIVSVNQIRATDLHYRYFLDFEPVDTIGYSLNIYHLSAEQIENWNLKQQTETR